MKKQKGLVFISLTLILLGVSVSVYINQQRTNYPETGSIQVSVRLEPIAYINRDLGISIHLPKGWKAVEGGWAPVSFFSDSENVDNSKVVMTVISASSTVQNLDALLIKINESSKDALIDSSDFKKLTLNKSVELLSGEEAYLLNGGAYYGGYDTEQGITLITLKDNKEYRVIAEGLLNIEGNMDLVLESMSSLYLK